MTGWKTVIFAVGTAVIGALQALDWAQVIPNNPQTVGMLTAAWGVAALVLRAFTSTPIGSSK